MQKEWTSEDIKQLILKNDKALYRGMLRIYDMQTTNEQYSAATIDKNGVGFNAYDAEFMTSLCMGLKKFGKLTDKQKSIARKRMLKYAGQLLSFVERN